MASLQNIDMIKQVNLCEGIYLIYKAKALVGIVKPKLTKAQLQALIKIVAEKVESDDQRAMKIFSQLVR